VWEHDRYPQYYVPLRALQNAAWDEVETVPLTSGDGEAVGAAVVRIRVRTPDGGLNPDGTERALRFADSAGVASKLAGHLRLEFASMGSCVPSPFDRVRSRVEQLRKERRS